MKKFTEKRTYRQQRLQKIDYVLLAGSKKLFLELEHMYSKDITWAQ